MIINDNDSRMLTSTLMPKQLVFNGSEVSKRKMTLWTAAQKAEAQPYRRRGTLAAPSRADAEGGLEDPSERQQKCQQTDKGGWRGGEMARGYFKIENSCLRSCVSLSISLARFVSAGGGRAEREARGKCDREAIRRTKRLRDTWLLFGFIFGPFQSLVFDCRGN